MVNSFTKADAENLVVLRGVSAESVMDVLTGCPVLNFSSGEILLRAGQINQNLYLILSGEIAIYLEYPGSEPVALLKKGETVGELSVIDDSAASAYVVAATDCRVLEVNDFSFWRLIAASHSFACNMLLLLSDRMRSSDETILKNMRLKKRFQKDALVDSLTGLHNRRWLDIQLPRLINRHVFSDRPLSVILFDVDNFKKFNDRYGHEAGDDVLSQVARVTMMSLRPTDLSARYGGEEFLVILAGIGSALAWIVAERLRKSMETTKTVTADGRELPAVTISLGIAESIQGDTSDTLLKRADLAMYRAKSLGRNKTCFEE